MSHCLIFTQVVGLDDKWFLLLACHFHKIGKTTEECAPALPGFEGRDSSEHKRMFIIVEYLFQDQSTEQGRSKVESHQQNFIIFLHFFCVWRWHLTCLTGDHMPLHSQHCAWRTCIFLTILQGCILHSHWLQIGWSHHIVGINHCQTFLWPKTLILNQLTNLIGEGNVISLGVWCYSNAEEKMW